MKAVHTIDHVVNTILRWIVMIMLSVMSVIVFAQVVFRIVHLSIPWSEELSKYLLIWSTFMGAALCVRKGSLVGLEFLQSALPERGQKALKIVKYHYLCDAGISYWCWFLGSSKSLFSDYAGFEAIHGSDVCCYSGGVSFYADQSDYYNDLFDQGG